MTVAKLVENFDERIPGSFKINNDPDFGKFLIYCCPCGCQALGSLRIGINEKPEESPSWNWNGSTDSPTLRPSVHHVGHWHGYLTDGVWVAC